MWRDAAPWATAFAFLSGLAMLAADLAGWALTGFWNPIDLGDVAAILGFETVAGVLGILFGIPLSILLIVVSALISSLLLSVWRAP